MIDKHGLYPRLLRSRRALR